jgi:multidrug efflux system membrane fusion protein
MGDKMMKGGVIVLFVLVQVLFFCSCSDRKEPANVQVERPLVSEVEVGEVALSEVPDFYETAATLTAQTISHVAARMMGTVTAVQVREGEEVQAGQLLAILDDRDVKQKVAAAAAALAEAEKGLAAAAKQQELADITYQRYARLFAGRALTQQELNQTKTAREVAALEVERLAAMVKRTRAAQAEARVYEEFTRITAPVTGVVIAKNVDTGDMAMPGAPLFTIEDNTSYTLDLQVSENFAGRLEKEEPVVIEIAATGGRFDGRILAVVPSVDPLTRTFLVKVSVSGPGLQGGLYAKARMRMGRQSVILLPEAAIIRRGELNGVYVVGEENILAYRLVRLGRSYGDMMEVLTGLAPGEKFVKAGVDKARDGGRLVEERKR